MAPICLAASDRVVARKPAMRQSETFDENSVNAAPQLLDTDVTLTDVDSAEFNGGSNIVGLILKNILIEFNNGFCLTLILV